MKKKMEEERKRERLEKNKTEIYPYENPDDVKDPVWRCKK
jgi:hypothetical protein